MGSPAMEPANYALARALVEETLRTGLVLSALLSNLLEALPEDAFPGEDPGRVLIHMLVGTIQPAAGDAGAQIVREATALVAALRERALDDLEAAAQLAGADSERTC